MNAGGVPNTCKSNGDIAWKLFEVKEKYLSGGRVSNAWATCLIQGDSIGKLVVKPHKRTKTHVFV